MHDPDVLLFEVPLIQLDVWHREPGGHDSGEVCDQWRRGDSIPAQLLFAVCHIRHLHYRWWPVFHVRKWVTDRCDHCGHRFRWREARFSYMSTDRVWHDVCMSLRHVLSQLDDLTGYFLGTADANARWRAEYRLEGIEARPRTDTPT